MALPPLSVAGSGNPLVAQAKGAVSHVLRMGQQPAMRRAMPAILILAVGVLAMAAFVLLREPSRVALYPGMAEADKARVVEALTGTGIVVSIDSLTGEIEVPSADYHRARMALAAQGLPQSLPDADAVLGALPMGASRSVEGMRLRQAQEADLARSITEITAVSGARVHLALPEKTAFLRDTQPPRASVFVTLAAGRMLEAGQIAAIVNLVSSSVPGLAQGDVTVVDQMGRLLSRGGDDPLAVVSDRQLQHRMELERLYRERIEALLTPIAGAGNLSVQVTVDMDFTQSQITEERVDPSQSALISEQRQESTSAEAQARGIPGAVSNTPPVQTDAPQGADGAAPADPAPAQTRSAGSTRNYEVSKTVSTTQPAGARIARISAAILMRAAPPPPPSDGADDGAAEGGETGASGGAEAPPLLPPALMADMERLAQTAIGFDAGRGDSITIAAQPFVTETAAIAAPMDLSWLPEATRQLALIAGLAIVALGIVRPLLTRLSHSPDLPAPAAVALGAMQGVEVRDGETLDDVQARLDARLAKLTNAALGAASTREEKFAVLRQIAAEDPARIASVIQKMMKADMPPSS